MFKAELYGKTSMQQLIVASSPLSLVSGTWGNDQLVHLVLGASLETRFGLQTISHASSTTTDDCKRTGVPHGLTGWTLPFDFPRPPP
jgi:hypothetical protein